MLFAIYCVAAPPTLLKLKIMKGADGKSLKIIQTIAAHDFITFGMCLLQDENGEEVDLIEKNHINKGADSVTKAILKKWLTSDAPTRTYQHLIESSESGIVLYYHVSDSLNWVHLLSSLQTQKKV